MLSTGKYMLYWCNSIVADTLANTRNESKSQRNIQIKALEYKKPATHL